MREAAVAAALAAAAAAESVAGVRDGQHRPTAAHPFVCGGAWQGRGASHVALRRQLLRQEGGVQEQVGLSRRAGRSARLGGIRAVLQMQGLAAQSGAGGAAAQSAGRGTAAGAGPAPMPSLLQPRVWLVVVGVLFADAQVGLHGIDHLLEVLDLLPGLFQCHLGLHAVTFLFYPVLLHPVQLGPQPVDFTVSDKV